MRIAAELSNTLSSLRVRFINNIICNKMHYFIDRFAWPGKGLLGRTQSSLGRTELPSVIYERAPARGTGRRCGTEREMVGINTRGNDRALGNLTTKSEFTSRPGKEIFISICPIIYLAREALRCCVKYTQNGGLLSYEKWSIFFY